MDKINAVIFAPAGDDGFYANECLRHIIERDYNLAGLIRGDWQALIDTFREGVATVAVVARAEHIDPDWSPRIEIVGHRAAPTEPDVVEHPRAANVRGNSAAKRAGRVSGRPRLLG